MAVSSRKTGGLCSSLYRLEGANTCLRNEWSFPSMSFKNQGKEWYSVIEAIWSDFMGEVSCLFYISLSVLNWREEEVVS